jgi:hypothetical protein
MDDTVQPTVLNIDEHSKQLTTGHVRDITESFLFFSAGKGVMAVPILPLVI